MLPTISGAILGLATTQLLSPIKKSTDQGSKVGKKKVNKEKAKIM